MNKPLYYLAHPYLSVGNTKENISESLQFEAKLCYGLDITIINPLRFVPKVTTDEGRAWDIVQQLFVACNAIILSGDWQNSEGCLKELKWANELNYKVYEYKEGKLKEYVG